ncbi:MAG: S-layer homology domain-containing protein [Acidimicrobiia bacterium]|nr:S-layer homology domain-containing protein [Acidimicrobiia bacterium]MDH4306501.1 S-layer homology domain-containing protein [Acidimicrobiia bacterium]MDH5292657.1 S-layer homology domain-containing protein [Acidimicrobiia bacterium]
MKERAIARPGWAVFWVMVVIALIAQPPQIALAADAPFSDVGGSVHGTDIALIAEWGITTGCNPPANDRYCPRDVVTRGQMAAFMRRSFNTPTSKYDYFYDDDTSVFEGDINSITGVGITTGCNPPSSTQYCEDSNITRGQMAAFLVRTLGLPGGPDAFGDDRDSVFENDVNALAAAGIAKGCSANAFCPDDEVTREQMASFLVRALSYLGCTEA